MFGDDTGSRQGFTLPRQTQPPFIVTRYPPVILWRQRPSVRLRPHDVPPPERERKRERGKEQREEMKKSTCDGSSESRERKREPSFSYGKCFFFFPPYKSSFLPRPCCLLASVWNVPYSTRGCSSMSLPSVFKDRRRLTDDQKVQGKAL